MSLADLAPDWQWTPRPTRCTYLLQHPCGLSFEVDAHQAETMPPADARLLASSMANAVEHTTSTES
jgi:hypothetical protein